MKDESQGGDTCKGCPPQPEHKGGQDPPDPPMIYATATYACVKVSTNKENSFLSSPCGR